MAKHNLKLNEFTKIEKDLRNKKLTEILISTPMVLDMTSR